MLLEEQFVADRRRYAVKYGYDIATGTFTTSVCSLEDHGPTTVSADNLQLPEPTNEDAERHCNTESQVRHRAERYAPYDTQTRITGTVHMFIGLV
jgi:hypothetical protein